MDKVPTQLENPTGLHQRYKIQKIEYTKNILDNRPKPIFKEIDEGAEYFIMRLDTGGSDIKHIAACRIGIHAYADAIYSHLPDLAIDLKTRYPLL